jgi:hypothetical protein
MNIIGLYPINCPYIMVIIVVVHGALTDNIELIDDFTLKKLVNGD